MSDRNRQINVRISDRVYYGLIAIGRKLADDGVLKGFKGGVSKVAALALEAVVDSYVKTGQITEEEIEMLMKGSSTNLLNEVGEDLEEVLDHEG